MKLFYNSEININDDDLIMSDSEHHHLTKVLRKKINDNFKDDNFIVSSDDGYYIE